MVALSNSSKNAFSVVFGLLLGSYILLTFTGSWLFWKRRFKHPLKARLPKFSIGFSLLSVVCVFLRCIDTLIQTDPWSCIFINSHLTTFYFSSFLIRAFVLWFRFEQVQEYVHYGMMQDQGLIRSDASLDESKTWFCKRKFLISEKALLSYSVVIFFLCFLTVPVQIATGECAKLTNFTTIVTLFLDFIILVITLMLGYKLRHEYDFFWIKSEFKINGIAAAIVGILFAIFNETIEENVAHILQQLILVLLHFCFTIFSIVYPVYLSYQSEKPEKRLIVQTLKSPSHQSQASAKSFSGEAHDLRKMMEIINNPVWYKTFEDFLIGELCVEGLVFYKAVERWKEELLDLEGRDRIRNAIERAKGIYQTFIKVGAHLELNVSSISKEKIEMNIRKLEELLESDQIIEIRAIISDIFDESTNEILNLICQDSFYRFKATPAFKSLSFNKRASEALIPLM